MHWLHYEDYRNSLFIVILNCCSSFLSVYAICFLELFMERKTLWYIFQSKFFLIFFFFHKIFMPLLSLMFNFPSSLKVFFFFSSFAMIHLISKNLFMAIGSSFFFHFLFVHLARLIYMVNEINTAMLVYFERNLSRSNDPKIEKLIIWLYIQSLGCLSGLLLDFLFL